MLRIYPFFLVLLLFVISCNRNITDEERKVLWENAQTQGEIVRRSGTPFNLATQKDLALSDAQNRLITGGGLLGNKANFGFGEDNNKNQSTTSIDIPVNSYLWRASIETINFMPLSSTDPFAGTMITDWYTSEKNLNERCKLNIFVKGKDLKSENLEVLSFCQILKNNQWVNTPSKSEENIKLENVILNEAKKIKLSTG